MNKKRVSKRMLEYCQMDKRRRAFARYFNDQYKKYAKYC